VATKISWRQPWGHQKFMAATLGVPDVLGGHHKAA
jgi:hypothetical protein